MIGWTNVGNNSSDLNNNLEEKARLRIKAPTGSVISILKGGNVIKTLNPFQGQVDAFDDYWSYYYIQVNQANYDEYTVNSLFNNRVNTRTVEITESNLYDVIIPPVIIIIKDGVFVDEVLESKALKSNSSSSSVAGAPNILLQDSNIKCGWWQGATTSSMSTGVVYYPQKIQVSLYNTLYLKAKWRMWKTASVSFSKHNFGVRFVTDFGTYQTDNSIFEYYPYPDEDATGTTEINEDRIDYVDLTSLNSSLEAYLLLRYMGATNGGTYQEITDLYLQ